MRSAVWHSLREVCKRWLPTAIMYIIQRDAGLYAHFKDAEYVDAGADLIESAEDLYSTCNLIVKVGPPTRNELAYLQEKQILFSALHLGFCNTGYPRASLLNWGLQE